MRLCIVMRLERRSCRSQHYGQILQMGTHHSDIPRVVARCGIVLFVRTIVFFVNDDKAQIFDGCKNSRSRANNDQSLSPANLAPGIVAFSSGQCTVQNRDAIAEMGAKAADGLWRQGDFRHQNNRAFSQCERVRNRPNIDQCFATACHPAQKVNPKGVFINALSNHLDGPRLMGRERYILWRRKIGIGVGIAHYFAINKTDQIALDHFSQYAR